MKPHIISNVLKLHFQASTFFLVPEKEFPFPAVNQVKSDVTPARAHVWTPAKAPDWRGQV